MALEQFASIARTTSPFCVRPHQHGAAVGFGTLVMDIAGFDQLLEIVGDVGAQIMTARAQFARRQFLIADVEQQQRLNAVDLAFVAAVELVLDHIEQLTMQTLNKIECFKIMLAERLCAARAPQLPAALANAVIAFPRFSQGPPLLCDHGRGDWLKRRKNYQRTPRSIWMMPEKSMPACPFAANSA